MARVPSYDNLQTRVDAGPTPNVGGPNPLTIVGDQQQQVGAATSRASDALSRIMLDAQDQANQVRVNDAMNQAMGARLKLTHDKDAGYSALQGRAALDRPDGKALDQEFGGKLDETLATISAGLGNDAQRRVFQAQAGQLAGQFRGQVQAHMGKESQQYELSTYQGTDKVAGDQITFNWNIPEMVAQGIGAKKSAITSIGKLLGWAPEYTQAKTIESISKAHESVVLQAIQSGWIDYAHNYMLTAERELTADDKLQIGHQFKIVQSRLDAKLNHEQDAAAKMAVESVQGLQKFVQDGMAPDVPYQNEIRMLTRGTPWAAQAEALISTGVASAGYGAQSLSRQNAILAASDGKATNPDEAANLAHRRAITDKQTAAYRDDPWEAAARFQRLPPVNAQQITAPGQLLKIAGERLPLMIGLETAGSMPAPLLRPAEVPQAIAQLQSASIRDRTEVLGQLGAMLDTKRQQALAEQLDKGDDSLSLTLKLGGDRTTSGRMVAELVQVGKQALGDKTVKKDETALSGWKADIAAHVRGSIGDPKAEDEIIRAAYYVRAAQELDSAKAPGFTRGFGSGAEDALAMVIGKPLDRGGVKTFLPKGMNESQFDSKAREVLAAGAGQTVYSRGQPVTVEALALRLSGYGMQMVRPGEYMPMTNNAPFTVDKEGRQPLRLRVQ